MSSKRTVEIFSAGCPLCDDTVARVTALAGASGEVVTRDMRDPQVARRAAALGVRSVPAVAVDGVLATCCAGRGPDEAVLRAAIRGAPPPGPPGGDAA